MSDSTKFTPGPWFYDGDHVFVDSRFQECCGRGDANGECCGIPNVGGDYGTIAETSERDAPLIAAAPCMFEALSRITPEFVQLLAHTESVAAIAEYADNDREIIELCQAALAKARGQTSLAQAEAEDASE